MPPGERQETSGLRNNIELLAQQVSAIDERSRPIEVDERRLLVAGLPDELATRDRRLGGCRWIGALERGGRSLELVRSGVREVSGGQSKADREKKVGVFLDGGIQLAHPRVEIERRAQSADAPGAVSGLPKRSRGSRHEPRVVEARCTRVLDCLQQVVCQDLGPVIRTIGGEGLDPVGDARVTSARTARDI